MLRPPPRPPLLSLAFAAATLALASCGRSRAIAEIEHAGLRADVAPALRGNAVFTGAWWSADGTLLVTQHHLADGLRAWRARDGVLLGRIPAGPIDGVLLVDGARDRVVARGPGLGAAGPLVVFAPQAGVEVASIPEDPKRPSALLGWVEPGVSIALSKPGWIEVWTLDPPQIERAVPSPLPEESYRPGPAPIPCSYHDERTAELSPSGHWLALASSVRDGGVRWSYTLVDMRSMSVHALALPPEGAGDSFTSFAWSPDDRWLALGTYRGLWLCDLERGEKTFVAGHDRRNAFLAPLRFTPDGRRVIALGDQLLVCVIDVETGEELARHEPPFDDWEGAVRVAPDGSRVVLYHFVSDTLEVLDGRDAHRIGWVCPYFCNVRHNPVRVHFEPSPDGRTLAASHRMGAALWELDTDRLLAPLLDPTLAPLAAP